MIMHGLSTISEREMPYTGITYLSVSPLWEKLLLACLGLLHTLCAKITTEESLPI